MTVLVQFLHSIQQVNSQTFNIMKRFLLYLLILTSLPAVAQYRGHGGNGHHGGSNPQGQASSLTIAAPRHQTFWLFIDDVLQNEQSVHSIRVNNLWPEEFYIRVELDDHEQHCFGQFIDLRRPQNFRIIDHHGFYGLEPTQGDIRPELVMDLYIGNIAPEPPIPPMPQEGIVVPVPPVQPEPIGMSPKDFDEAFSLIQNESFDDTRLTIAKQVVASNKMTVNQIAQIARLFSYENNKLEFAKFAYPYCVEKNKYYLLYEVFDHDSTKQELNEYIQKM